VKSCFKVTRDTSLYNLLLETKASVVPNALESPESDGFPAQVRRGILLCADAIVYVLRMGWGCPGA
jgi:hypothetical protein